MKKYIICFSLFCYLLYSNICLVSANAAVGSESIEDPNATLALEMPELLNEYEYYSPRSATLALGSLGLTTAEGVAILGGVASVVAPILGAVALVGGAIVVGQGLVNIYDYVTEYALTKEEAEKLDVSTSIKKNGTMHLQLVPKKNGVPEPPIKPDNENKSNYIKILSGLLGALSLSSFSGSSITDTGYNVTTSIGYFVPSPDSSVASRIINLQNYVICNSSITSCANYIYSYYNFFYKTWTLESPKLSDNQTFVGDSTVLEIYTKNGFTASPYYLSLIHI